MYSLIGAPLAAGATHVIRAWPLPGTAVGFEGADGTLAAPRGAATKTGMTASAATTTRPNPRRPRRISTPPIHARGTDTGLRIGVPVGSTRPQPSAPGPVGRRFPPAAPRRSAMMVGGAAGEWCGRPDCSPTPDGTQVERLARGESSRCDLRAGGGDAVRRGECARTPRGRRHRAGRHRKDRPVRASRALAAVDPGNVRRRRHVRAPAAALALGTLLLVQPLLVCGLLVALPLNAHWTGRSIRRSEWVAALVLSASVATFLVEASPSGGESHASVANWFRVGGTIALIVAGAIVGAALTSGHVRATLLGFAAGTMFGLTAALTKTFVDQIQHGVGFTASHWEVYALATLSITGILVTRRGFHAASLSASLPALEASEPLVAAIVGVSLLHEHLNGRHRVRQRSRSPSRSLRAAGRRRHARHARGPRPRRRPRRCSTSPRPNVAPPTTIAVGPVRGRT